MTEEIDSKNGWDKEETEKTQSREEKILASLLEDPKTNTELSFEMYGSNKKHGNISKLLDNLQKKGYIMENRKKSPYLDEYCTQWSIVPNLDNFRYIGKYPDLLPVLQKKDFVREIIAENTRIPITYSINIYQKDKEIFIPGKEELHPLGEKDKKIFKEMLRLSPEFFKYHLFHNSVMSVNDFNNLALTLKTIDEIHGLHPRWIGWGYYYQYFMAFKVCVLRDLLYGNSIEGEKEYLIELEKEKVKEHSDYPNINSDR